jgi:hypothetical protein
MPAAQGTQFNGGGYGPDHTHSHGHHPWSPPPVMGCGWQPDATDFTMNHLLEDGMGVFTPHFHLDYKGDHNQMFTLRIDDYEFQHQLWYDGLGTDVGNTTNVRYFTRIGHEGEHLESIDTNVMSSKFSYYEMSHNPDMNNCSVRSRKWKMNLAQLLELGAEVWDEAHRDYIIIDFTIEIIVFADSPHLQQKLERTVAIAKQKIKINRITPAITCDVDVTEQRQATLFGIDYDHDSEEGKVCFTVGYQNQHWIKTRSYDFMISSPYDYGYQQNMFYSAGYRTGPAADGLLNNETSICSDQDDQTCQTTFDLCFHRACSTQFQLHHEKLTWQQASDYCRNHPDFEYLGSPRTQSEIDQVEGIIDYGLHQENGHDGRINQSVWIGLNRRNQKWEWDQPSKDCIFDGPFNPDLNNCSDYWAPGQPLNGMNQDCAAINAETTKFENEEVCQEKNPSICSRDHEHHIHLGGVWKFAVPVQCRYDDPDGQALCDSTFHTAGFVHKPNGWYQLFHIHINEFNLDCNIQMDKQHVKIEHDIENYGRDYHNGANPIHSEKFETYDLLRYRGELDNIEMWKY